MCTRRPAPSSTHSLRRMSRWVPLVSATERCCTVQGLLYDCILYCMYDYVHVQYALYSSYVCEKRTPVCNCRPCTSQSRPYEELIETESVIVCKPISWRPTKCYYVSTPIPSGVDLIACRPDPSCRFLPSSPTA